jgi:hypothetical protein
MHLLVGTPHPHATVLAVAAREGWRAQEVDTGLFAIVKVWIEDRFLVEFMEGNAAARYAAAFGGTEAGMLDARMRAYEAELGPRLAARVPSEVLRAALGEATS